MWAQGMLKPTLIGTCLSKLLLLLVQREAKLMKSDHLDLDGLEAVGQVAMNSPVTDLSTNGSQSRDVVLQKLINVAFEEERIHTTSRLQLLQQKISQFLDVQCLPYPHSNNEARFKWKSQPLHR